jgi:CheY-like chemotaxis protein
MKGKLFLVMWDEDAACHACDLRDAGWFVDLEHEDGGQAFRVIRADPPDVVVIDLSRKPSHGREVARALRDNSATRALPLIVVEGDDASRERLRSIAPDAMFVAWVELLDALELVARSGEDGV